MSRQTTSRRGRPPEPQPPRSSPALRVRVVKGPAGARSAALPEVGEEGLLIGRRAMDGLAIDDDTIAPRHLVVERVEGGVRLHARKGCDVFIGALLVRDVIVPLGTRFRVGDTLIELVHATEGDDLRGRMAAEGFIYADPAMTPVAEAVAELAPFTMSILIEGETGTGKEVISRALHQLSLRSTGPFEIVDCGALPRNLVESELFGHEPGAFTGATRARKGAFERAHGGTLLLDEIGELPLEVQPVLLGVLQRRRMRRVGSERDQSVDVRVLAATNHSLEEDIREGCFRSDLYYRLAAARIELPPLRERPADVAPIAETFVGELTGQPGRGPLDEVAWEALSTHGWPGNVRELRAVIERAVATGRVQLGSTVTPARPSSVSASAGPPAGAPQPAAAASADDVRRYKDARTDALTAFEKHYLGELIRLCEGNASQAARVAQMDRPHLLRLLRRHGLR